MEHTRVYIHQYPHFNAVLFSGMIKMNLRKPNGKDIFLVNQKQFQKHIDLKMVKRLFG